MSDTPSIRLRDGALIPQLGFGTSGLGAQGHLAVLTALRLGYRHFDTAQMYYTEHSVGAALSEFGVRREDVFVTTKLDNHLHSRDEVLRSFDESLEALGLDSLDLFLIHWPFSRVRDYVSVWRTLIELRDSRRVSSIGVSNFREHELRRLIDETGTPPAVNQIEVHPYVAQDDLRATNARYGIATEAWSPLGFGVVLDDPVLASIAASTGRSVAQVVLRWHIQRGDAVIPKTESPARMRENFEIFDFQLSDADMTLVDSLNRGQRTGPDPEQYG